MPAFRRWLQPFHARFAIFGGLAAPIILIFGRGFADPLHVAIAAGAAFSVGFGASRELAGQRWGAMAAAAASMAVAGFCGTLAGANFVLLATLSAALAAFCAVLALRDEDWWWSVLQMVIAFLVAGYFPGDFEVALGRFVATLSGGAVQIACVALLAHLAPGGVARLPKAASSGPPSFRLSIAHGLRAAIAIGASLSIAYAFGLANDYWAPITALIVLKPGLNDTRMRGLLRASGTIGGCALATLYARALHDNPLALGLGASVMIFFCYGLQKAHYAIFSAAVTIFVVLITSFGQGATLDNAEHRLLATMLGCAIAIGVAWVFPHRPVNAAEPGDRLGAADGH